MGLKKPVVGLCGGIGAGKTRVAEELGRLGCAVVSSDRLNHEVLRRPEVLAVLRGWWGDAVVTSDGRPDRRRIAEIVFEDPAEKKRLESLVYPLIAEARRDRIRAIEDRPAIKAIVLDSPLLFESNLDRECDTVLFVDASDEQRLERLRAERGWDAEEVRRRERWQLPLDEKRNRSEFVVDNTGSTERLGLRVAEILDEILKRHGRGD